MNKAERIKTTTDAIKSQLCGRGGSNGIQIGALCEIIAEMAEDQYADKQPNPAPKKTRGEEVAEKMVELVERGNGCQSMRFVGQSDLLWHSADAGLMRERHASTVKHIAAAIDAERKAERERCANAVDEQISHDTQSQIDLNSAVRRIRALPD